MIPPGSEGKITVRVSTTGYGGGLIRQHAHVETNDPRLPRIELLLSGEVQEFARIDPNPVILKGKAGTEVKATVTITPIHPFAVRKVHARDGAHIHVRMQETLVEGSKVFTIIVGNTMNAAGTYTDSIMVETDSPIRSRIVIGVKGEIS